MPEPLWVSDHALVRYLERVRGMDLNPYRQELRQLAEAHEGAPATSGGTWDGGLVIVIEQLGKPVIVTVLGPGYRPKRPRSFTRLIYVPPASEAADV